MPKNIRTIAFHLPQFHPIPENDEWWGKGFTEWTNTAKAKPMFPGHYQPHVPADLGFYDLRLAESRAAQAELAKSYGLEGFCYYHYWFGGRRILERPVNEILDSHEPNFPFCLCWANHSWNSIWQGSPDKILIEQNYPGMDDHKAHFDFLLRAFKDPRYIKTDGKPVFVIFRPMEIPNVREVVEFWRKLAAQSGLDGLHLVGIATSEWNPQEYGFDASIVQKLPGLRGWVSWRTPLKRLMQTYQKIRGYPTIYSYAKVFPMLLSSSVSGIENYPSVIPNWDNTPRSGKRGLVLHGSTPELFRRHFRDAIELAQKLPDDRKFLFIKSWNEWAEGNHLEPDLKWGHDYLKIVAEELAS